MTRQLTLGSAAVVALVLSPLGVSADSPGRSVARLSWLAGCWERTDGTRRVDEQWMQPGGGLMLGMSRTVAADTTLDFEYMLIREDGYTLVFTARPSGQSEASFRSVEVTASRVVFENLAHDFPQRIIYRLEADGSLHARIEGKQGGGVRGVDFPMKRTRCAGDPGD